MRPASRSESLASYKLGKRLGAGAFGEVCLATRKRDNFKCVIKGIPVVGVSRKEQELALNEVRLLSRVAHPRICRYYSSFVEDDQLRIVMEYCEGGDLRRFIVRRNDKPIAEREIWKYVSHAAQGVAHLHSLKVLHRDLKSSNFFLRHGELLVGDLGCSRLLDATNGHATTMVGTPYYLSPELCNNEAYDAKSDVWALGVVAYELLTCGKYPYTANNQAALIMRILRGGEYDPPPASYSPELRENVVAACLRQVPSERPTAAELIELPSARVHVPTAVQPAAAVRGEGRAQGEAAAAAHTASPPPPPPQQQQRPSSGRGGGSARGAAPTGGGGFEFDAKGYARYEAAKAAKVAGAQSAPRGAFPYTNAQTDGRTDGRMVNGGRAAGAAAQTAPRGGFPRQLSGSPPKMSLVAEGGEQAALLAEGAAAGGAAEEEGAAAEGDPSSPPGTRLFDDIPYSPPRNRPAGAGAPPHICGGARPGGVAAAGAASSTAAVVAANARMAARVAAAATPGRVGYARAHEARSAAAVALAQAPSAPRAPAAAQRGGNRVRRMGPMNVQARADAASGVGPSNARMGIHAARYERRLAEARRAEAAARREMAAREREECAASVRAQLAAHDARGSLALPQDDDEEDESGEPGEPGRRHPAIAAARGSGGVGAGGGGAKRPTVAQLHAMMRQVEEAEAAAEAEQAAAEAAAAEAAEAEARQIIEAVDWEADDENEEFYRNDFEEEEGGGSSPSPSLHSPQAAALSHAAWLPLPAAGGKGAEDEGEQGVEEPIQGRRRQGEQNSRDGADQFELEHTLPADAALDQALDPSNRGALPCSGAYARPKSFTEELADQGGDDGYDAYATTEGEEEEGDDCEATLPGGSGGMLPDSHLHVGAPTGTAAGGVGWRIC